MKEIILILSLLLFVGCNKSSTSSEPSCTELATTYGNTSTAWGYDTENRELCDANSDAYLALANSDCPGFEDLSQEQINAVTSMCDLLTGG